MTKKEFYFQAAALTFLAMLYVILFITDTRGPYSPMTETESFDLIGAFSIFNVMDVFKTCLKRRENYIRAIMMLLIMAMLFNLSTISKSFKTIFLPRNVICHLIDIDY